MYSKMFIIKRLLKRAMFNTRGLSVSVQYMQNRHWTVILLPTSFEKCNFFP